MPGVQQGSVLGPLLFTIYINDILTVIKHSQYLLYADDLQCYISARPDSINGTINKLTEDLHCITEWTKKLYLKLNPEKTQAIIMGHKRLLSSVNECEVCSVKVNSTEIHYSSVVKNLGVYMDKHLDWSKQVASTCKKVFSIIHTLQRVKIFLPTSLRKTLVQTLVMPHFDYGDVLLTDLNSDLTTRLQRAHNMCVRFIFNIRRYDHITPSFEALNWVPLTDHRNSELLYFKVFVFRFQYVTSHHHLNTRSRLEMILTILFIDFQNSDSSSLEFIPNGAQ